jgi:hypothetical protein
LIPALSGAIGKIHSSPLLHGWATGLGITDPQFITENVRLEIMIGSLFTLVFIAVLNPLPVRGHPCLCAR